MRARKRLEGIYRNNARINESVSSGAPSPASDSRFPETPMAYRALATVWLLAVFTIPLSAQGTRLLRHPARDSAHLVVRLAPGTRRDFSLERSP